MQLDRVTLGKEAATTEFEKNLEKSFQRLIDQLSQILNKGLLFSENFSANILTFTSAAADVEFAVAHTLKRVPTGYIIVSMSANGALYDGPTAWTTTNIYLKDPTGSVTFKALIF